MSLFDNDTPNVENPDGLLGVSDGGTGRDKSADVGVLQQLTAGAAVASSTAPTISSFANATHNHQNAAGGGQIAGASVLSEGTTGTGAFVRATSPTLVTPTLGAALATTLQTSGNVGAGVAPSATVGDVLWGQVNGNNGVRTVMKNTEAVGAGAFGGHIVEASTARVFFIAYGAGYTPAGYGVVLGNYSEFSSNIGNGLLIGTRNAAGLWLGTANQQRQFIAGAAKTLTESSATGLVDIALANNTVLGGTLFYTIQANDASDFQTLRGRVDFAAVSKAGTITVTAGTPTEITAVSVGTLSNTFTVTTGATKITLNLNAVSSLTQTTLRATFSIELSGGAGTITPL